jgi:hypothetical protein
MFDSKQHTRPSPEVDSKWVQNYKFILYIQLFYQFLVLVFRQSLGFQSQFLELFFKLNSDCQLRLNTEH